MIQWEIKNFYELSKDELYSILKFRMEIFILEQKSFYLDLDDLDQSSTHFLGTDNGMIVVYGRVFIDNLQASTKIRRVAVHQDFRGKQVGLSSISSPIWQWANL